MDLLDQGGFDVNHLFMGIFYAPRPSLSFIGLHNVLMGPAQVSSQAILQLPVI